MRSFPWDGTKLRDLRLARRLGAPALAEMVGVSSAYLSMLERNLRKPSIELVARLEEALGATASELGADVPDRPAGSP